MTFSVTIPTYKNQFLKEAIDSVLAQSWRDFELIIVNDASPYDIDAVVSQYDDSRIRYFKNERNCGAKNVVDNWNICLSYAQGDYLMCIGDDDRLKPNCLQDFADAIGRYPEVELFHAGTEVIDDRSVLVRTLELRPERESVYDLIADTQGSGLGSYLFKTATLRQNGGFYRLPYGWSSDFITAYMAARNHGLVNVQTAGFQYRGNSQSISYDMSGVEDKIASILHYKNWIRNFLDAARPTDSGDAATRKRILSTLDRNISRNIDGLVEFDIRKNKFRRGLHWLARRHAYGISWQRYVKCVLNSIRYSLR